MVRFFTMRRLTGLIALQALGLAAIASAGDRTAEEARPRVEHHLLEAAQIVRHFESVLAEDCPRFDSAVERRAYVDGEVERVVLLVAHLEEAWSEAKRTCREGATHSGRSGAEPGHEAPDLYGRRREPGAANDLATSRAGSAAPACRDCPPLMHRGVNSTSASSSPPDTAA